MARDGMAIEKSADALDEVQFATERELAIRNQDTSGRDPGETVSL